MYLAVTGLKATVELVALLYLAQLLVRVLSFGTHERNPVYAGLRFLTSPVTRLARILSPRRVLDRHMPVLGFVLCCWAWLALLIAKAQWLAGAN